MVRKNSVKRQAILDALCQSCEHPSAEMLYEQLKPEIPDLSLGTVYRNLSMFCEDGAAMTVGKVDGKERFDGKTFPHTHFICRGCKRVLDVEEPLEGKESYEASLKEIGFKPESYSLTFSGLCNKCN